MYGHGWCRRHYMRWYRHGSTENKQRKYKDSSLYYRWRSMIARCHKPNSSNWKYYGANGIRVCDRWRKSYQNFYDDMGLPPTENHTLDRVNPNGDYEPNNCRWADKIEQRRNRTKSEAITFNGVTMMPIDWAKHLNINYWVLAKRLQAGWPIQKALTQPVRRYPKKERI